MPRHGLGRRTDGARFGLEVAGVNPRVVFGAAKPRKQAAVLPV